jgi:hypothetical protein
VNEVFTEAIRYWEKKRIIYNVGLLVIVVGCFATGLPGSLDKLNIMFALQVFVLAVLANVAFCAAYIADVFVQYSDFSLVWRKYRWILFIIGFSFAAINTWFISTGLFSKTA